MTQSLSIYLDLVRFMAAIAVFLNHTSFKPFTDNLLWWRLGYYGDVAVIIFFVLSGYVIAYVSSFKERTVTQYFVARASRLYSVVALALLLTIALDTLGRHFNPEFYTLRSTLLKPESWAGYISSAFFLNEYSIFGFHGIAPGTNAPFWSLSFEVTYYAIAGFALFSRRSIAVPAAILILLAAGRTIAALFPIWILGFMLFRLSTNWKPPKLISWILFFSSVLVILSISTFVDKLPRDNFGWYFPWAVIQVNRNLVADYIGAGAFAINLVAAREILGTSLKINDSIKKSIQWLGSLTFPLYCIHYPAICFFTAISPWQNTTALNYIFICFSTLVLVIVVTLISEHLKFSMRARLLNIANDDNKKTPNEPLKKWQGL